MSNSIEFHPIANIFPMLPKNELTELAEDIRQNGLHRAILLFDGKVLDGRNRIRACEMADVGARFEVFHGETTEQALSYVLSTNLHRRHLTTFQKFEAITRAGEIRKNAKERQVESGRQRAKKVPAESAGTFCDEQNQQDTEKYPHEGEAAYDFAKMLNLSPRTVYKMGKLVKEAPEVLLDVVRRGAISIDCGLTLASGMEEEELAQIVETSEPEALGKRMQAAAKKVKTDKGAAKPKRRKRRPSIRMGEAPFQDVDVVDMKPGRLRQFWMQVTSVQRAEFLTWVNENRELYPFEEALKDE